MPTATFFFAGAANTDSDKTAVPATAKAPVLRKFLLVVCICYPLNSLGIVSHETEL
jgi:hypothetical protein